jgi:hypothetical protein
VPDQNKKVKLIPEIYKERLLVEFDDEITEAFPADQPPS